MNNFCENCFENWKLSVSLHPQLSGYGEIGRHARLRIWCRKACRFESYYPHKKSPNLSLDFFYGNERGNDLYFYREYFSARQKKLLNREVFFVVIVCLRIVSE